MENDNEESEELNWTHDSVVYRDPYFDDLQGTPLQNLLSPLQHLEEIMEHFLVDKNSQYQTEEVSELIQLEQKAMLKISQCLALMTQYQTTSTLQSFLNFLRSDNNKNWDQFSANIEKDLRTISEDILSCWKSYQGDDNTHKEVLHAPLESLASPINPKPSLQFGYLIIDGEIKYVKFNEGVLSYYSKEPSSDSEKCEGVIDVTECSSLEEEIRSMHAHALILGSSKNVYNISIPYPHKPWQKSWIELFTTWFIKGRYEFMKKSSNAGHELIQENCCFYLSKFGTNLPKQAKVQLVKEGMIKYIVAAQKAFPANYNLQYYALGAINNFTLKIDYPKMMAGVENTISSILDTMKKFQNDIPLQILACKTIQSLAFGVEYNKVLFINYGGIEVSAQLMKKLRREQELQTVCIGALSCILSTSDESKQRIIACNGLTELLKTMNLYSDNLNIQHYGLGALVNLANDTNTLSAIAMTENAGEVIVQSMMTFKENEQLIYRALCLLNSLAEKNSVNVRKWVTSNLLDDIHARFQDQEDICSLCQDLKRIFPSAQ